MGKIALMILVWIFGSTLIVISCDFLELYSIQESKYATKGRFIFSLYTILMLFIIFMELLYKLLIY